jgi:hypothetical protein
MSKEIVSKIEDAPSIVAPVNPLVGMITFIERCALNPDISVDKMNQLFDIQERMMNKQAEIEYNIAFAEMQAELPPIPAKKKGQSGKHFTKADANILIGPVLQKYGFALNHTTTQEGDSIRIRATLRHRAGHSEFTEIVLPYDVGGNKNKVQAIGSSQSYGERYTMKSILNLTIIGDETDDDGEAAQKKKNSFQENVSADAKKTVKTPPPPKNASPEELAWDKKTILLLEGKSLTFTFKSSQEGGEKLLTELGQYPTKKERIHVVNLNMPILRALIKKGDGDLITKIHKFADAGE